eukprot:s534_g8.t1
MTEIVITFLIKVEKHPFEETCGELTWDKSQAVAPGGITGTVLEPKPLSRISRWLSARKAWVFRVDGKKCVLGLKRHCTSASSHLKWERRKGHKIGKASGLNEALVAHLGPGPDGHEGLWPRSVPMDQFGLLDAAYDGYTEKVERLATVCDCDCGHGTSLTALISACHSHLGVPYLEMVKLLHRANVDVKDDNDWTPREIGLSTRATCRWRCLIQIGRKRALKPVFYFSITSDSLPLCCPCANLQHFAEHTRPRNLPWQESRQAVPSEGQRLATHEQVGQAVKERDDEILEQLRDDEGAYQADLLGSPRPLFTLTEQWGLLGLLVGLVVVMATMGGMDLSFLDALQGGLDQTQAMEALTTLNEGTAAAGAEVAGGILEPGLSIALPGLLASLGSLAGLVVQGIKEPMRTLPSATLLHHIESLHSGRIWRPVDVPHQTVGLMAEGNHAHDFLGLQQAEDPEELLQSQDLGHERYEVGEFIDDSTLARLPLVFFFELVYD